jgi:Fe-S-cluster containining protein
MKASTEKSNKSQNPVPRDSDVYEAAHKEVHARIGANPTASTISELVFNLGEKAQKFADYRIATDPPATPIACREGCSFCCYIRVHLTPMELIFLVHSIQSNFSENEIEALKNRLETIDPITHGMTDEERGRAKIPCPLLVNNRCSAYEARPQECRGYNSTNVEACRQAFNNYDIWDVPIFFPQYSAFKNTQAALARATNNSIELLELTTALRIALDDDTAIDRWLAGGNPFQKASLPMTDPEVIAFSPWTPTFDNSTP